MDKFREALREAFIAGRETNFPFDMGLTVSEIASRYGPFFSEKEAWKIAEAAAQEGKIMGNSKAADEVADHILSRHTEAEPLAACGDCGRELEEVRPGKHQCTYCEIVRAAAMDLEDRLTKRLAAIEKRVLADGHSRNCRAIDPRCSPYECTCGHEEIKEERK